MKNLKILLLFAIISLFLIGCGQTNTDAEPGNNNQGGITAPGGVMCAQDVKECSDGSFVARNPNKNCEFDPCVGESNNKELDSQISDLQKKARALTSYEYIDDNTTDYIQVRGEDKVIRLRDAVYLREHDFYYNTIYFVDDKAYGYCFTDKKYSSHTCNMNKIKNYVEVDYDKYYPKSLAMDWLLNLDNGKVTANTMCDNRNCYVIEFEKDGKLYKMEARLIYGLPHRVFELGKENQEFHLATYTGTSFNHLKESDIKPPEGYTLLE